MVHMSSVNLENTIEDLHSKVVALDNDVSPRLREFKAQLNAKLQITTRLEEASSRSWAGYHANLYYKEYERPSLDKMFNPEWGGISKIPEGWSERTIEEVTAYVESIHGGILLEEIEKNVQGTVERVAALKSEICTELSPFIGIKGMDNESELLQHLERITYGHSANDYVKQRIPDQITTRDTRAIFQGIGVPPHVWYQARIFSTLSAVSAIENTLTTSKRLIRQMEIKQSLREEGATVKALEDVLRVCERFHEVSRQLRKRHENRKTLEVEDEYDVQDLLQAILKLYFDDIRSEEWSPSYAGGASRMDFLLKDERIVVEVKKTRNRLTDKEIGEQLIVDIAKYQQHPDCDTLVCFVYDPEGRIANPRGLENDLALLASEKLNVVVIIRPK